MALTIAADNHPLNNIVVMDYLKETFGVDDVAWGTWYAHWITRGFIAVEQMIDADSFAFGSEPTVADICIVPQVFNAKRYPSFDLKPHPAIMRIFAECLKLPAFERAVPENQPDAEP